MTQTYCTDPKNCSIVTIKTTKSGGFNGDLTALLQTAENKKQGFLLSIDADSIQNGNINLCPSSGPSVTCATWNTLAITLGVILGVAIIVIIVLSIAYHRK